MEVITLEKLSFPELSIYRESNDYIIHNFQLNSWVVLNEKEYMIASELIFNKKSVGELIGVIEDKNLVKYVVNLLLLYKIGFRGELPQDYNDYFSNVNNSLEGMKPSVVYFVTTYKCNLNCIYCYAESSPQRSMDGDLTTEEALNMFDEIKELGAKTIVFTGGEAFLRKDIFELMEYVKSLNMKVNVITNGSLIQNKKKAERLSKVANLVTISLDSMNENEHDLNRGKGTWAKAKNAIDLLLESGCNIKINQTITKNNLFSSEQILKFTKRNKIQLKIIPTSSLGRGKNDELSQSLNQDERREFEKELYRLSEEDLENNNYSSIKQFEHRKHCGHGSGEFSIDSKGNVYLCKLMHEPNMLAGNIKVQELSKIYHQSPLFIEARKRTVYNLPECKKCTFKEFCGGGCRAIQASETGDINGTNYLECIYIRKSFRKQMWNYFKKSKKEVLI